ncbi:hypothetical protein L7F22_065526 [Adiantum nelumboides]|nr:hypothetical protein [Adiantum nelumboides]
MLGKIFATDEYSKDLKEYFQKIKEAISITLQKQKDVAKVRTFATPNLHNEDLNYGYGPSFFYPHSSTRSEAGFKYALKAQQLFPSLENMVQIMAVIDVHMAALVKIAGCNERDWYGILQVEPQADEAAVKKQYRKLALYLHPDKNKLSGAEAAFKLIGEASQVLSDKTKRAVYNAKRGLAQTRANPLAPSRNQRANNKQSQQQQNMQNVAPQLHPFTFWTACPFCQMRYQYMRKFEDKNLLCLTCRKAFIAKDLMRVNPTQFPSSQTGQPKHSTAGVNAHANGSYNAAHLNNPAQAASAPKAGPVPVTHTQNGVKTAQAASAPKAGPVPVTHTQNGVKAAQKDEAEKDLHRKAHDFLKSVEQQEKERAKQYGAKVAQKNEIEKELPKKVHDSLKPMAQEEKERAKQNGAKVAEREEVEKEFHKKAHEVLKSMDKEQPNQNGTKAAQEQVAESELHRRAHEFLKSMQLEKDMVKQKKEQAKHTNVTNNCASDLPKEGNILGKEQQRRAEEIHKAAMLQRVEELRRSMELQKELERQRDQLRNMSATEQRSFIPGTEEKEIKMEHVNVPFKANKKRGRNYDESSCSSGTEEDEKDWKEVAANWKNEGLPRRSSRSKRNVTYCSDSDDDFQHMPPSKKAKIDEVGCHEQGTKKLNTPQKLANLAKQAIRARLSLEKSTAFAVEDEAQMPQNGRRPVPLEKNSTSEVLETVSVSSCTIPDADFFNFDKGREEKDVEVGQVWALYDDMDGLPRYYMKVKDVRLNPFKVSVGWFEVRKPTEEQSELLDSGHSFACGEFRMSSSQVMHSVNSFSHLMKWEKVGKSMMKIYPKKGEVWCLYKEWKEGQLLLKASDTPLKYCMVEILTDCNQVSGVATMLLKKVEGFKTVYRSADGQVLGIPFVEALRFSHQVPAHKLAGNEGLNAPKDCWELDPAALPSSFIQPDAVA